MNRRIFGILAVSLLTVALGCEKDNVPSIDVVQDTNLADTQADTITQTDTVVDTDVRDDANVPDTIEDNGATDVQPVDTAIPDADDDVEPVDAAVDTGTDTGTPVACTTNAQCEPNQFCDAEQCGGNGVCANKPELCLIPSLPDPICACDGNYYDSKCFAGMAGADTGIGADCGSGDTCADDTGCGEGSYCKKDTCAAAEGVCATKPLLCPITPNSVCGCDGTTYTNSCMAAGAGINEDNTGNACSGVVTCTANADCTSGFCYKTSCEASAEGVCTEPPLLCLTIGTPVCGCDGNTYNNECLAKKAEVSTDATGVACGAEVSCSSNADCLDSEYCAKTACGDATGTCTKIPLTCKPLTSEVCGCDNTVYPNACYAAKGRTNTMDISECLSTKTCTTNLSCGSKMAFCQYELSGGVCTTNGHCADRPATCEDATVFVCDCDNNTYKNFCEAAKAMKTVKYIGKCGLIEL